VATTFTLGLKPGESKLLKYQSAAEYHSTTTSETIVPPATGSAHPGSRRERTTISLAANAP
jgi:hypothetical protein